MSGDFTPIIKSEKVMGEILVTYEEYFNIVENVGSFKVFRNKEKKRHLFIGSEMISYSQEVDKGDTGYPELGIFGEIFSLISQYILNKEINCELQIRGNVILIDPNGIIEKADRLLKESLVNIENFNLIHLGFATDNKEYRFGMQPITIKNEDEEEIEGQLIDFYRFLSTDLKIKKAERLIEETLEYVKEEIISEMR